MKIFLFMIALLLCSSYVFADDSGSTIAADSLPVANFCPTVEQCASRSDNKIVLSEFDSHKESERRGCCSHHGGVCGCSSGRAVCCDGSLSPSCGC